MKTHTARRLALFSLAAISLLGGGVPPAVAQPQKIVVYTVIPDAEVNRRINEEFTKRTGIQVEVLNVPAVGTVASRIRGEKDRPRGDVFAAAPVDFHAALAKDGLIELYKSPLVTADALKAGYADPQGAWTGWYAMTTCIFWNTDRFNKEMATKGVGKPSSWDDLLKPAYKDHVILANPQTSAIGYVLLATQIFRSGEEKAWAYTRELNKNVKQYTPSAPLTVSLVAQGEGTAGAFWLADVLNAKVNGKQPLDFAVPSPNVVNIWAASIIKGGPNTEGARKYIDFLLSEYPQEINSTLGFRHPLNPKVAAPAGAPSLAEIKQVAYDNTWATDNMDRVRKQWRTESGQ
ncbi:extracellular solute-binding protein [Hydrogenophaga laconesensis]|uniref:Iron(III) transport system substrate-binding protein n=1 Tax=Hydrogenophaga laconesensis TaxID=1805971 RepID=A0ABU1V6Y6_9BURK|nr:extracellular solute-binding protein [Hydrogenophaga laconesensis]MDR7093228.1 iron(III) transport system substrate-binding protein [Hydrogenophaga laconesensis]